MSTPGPVTRFRFNTLLPGQNGKDGADGPTGPSADAVALISDSSFADTPPTWDSLFPGSTSATTIVFQGATTGGDARNLALPAAPVVGQRCTLVSDGSMASGKVNLTISGGSISLQGAAATSPVQALQYDVSGELRTFSSLTVMWTGLSWLQVAGVNFVSFL